MTGQKKEQPPTTYADAGVDIDAGARAVQMMKEHVRGTYTPAVLAELGTFGAMFMLDIGGMKVPVLVSSADGVGTKLKVAFMANRHTTVGQDLVNHCVNDILVQGARALFFMDYYAVGKLDPLVAAQVVEGLSIACKAAGCALIGGETAEMPDMYTPGEYDLAGFIVGIIDREKIITGEGVRPGDVVIGLASDGMHTNGYSLVRKLVFEIAKLGPEDRFPWGPTVADELLRVHRCYAPAIHPLLADNLVQAMAHITGGGLPGNVVRTLPEGCRIVLTEDNWAVPEIFTWMSETGNVPRRDLLRTVNMGIGYTLVVRPDVAQEVVTRLTVDGENARIIGEVIAGKRGVGICCGHEVLCF
ncbi:MAG: phosphoribosylformylglycinamidine cyclo-ligase [Patescibacteria group bacterium]